MEKNIYIIPKKITLLNQTILDSMAEKSDNEIIKKFTNVSIKILEADFGFAWWKFNDDEKYKLAYKSPNTPYNPTAPRENAGNYIARKTKKPFFDSNIKKENYEFDILRYLKSYLIIPINYGDAVYGSLVLCYKKSHKFTEDEMILSDAIGNSAAQAITIYRLVLNKKESVILKAKQKETEVLLEQEKFKNEFLANTTHEFRTPLAIMRGNVDLALASKDGKKKSKMVESSLKIIEKEIAYLSGTISGLAILTSDQKNIKNIIHSAQIDLIPLITHIAKRLNVLMHKKSISLKINTPKNKQIFIEGDKEYLEKLFINLIRNAIIYGKQKGKIIIDIEEKNNNAIIKVADNGIGIAKKDLPHIFERFYRTEKAREMTTIGTGLGLAICKWIAESHSGNISVKSTPDVGSTFTVILPKKGAI